MPIIQNDDNGNNSSKNDDNIKNFFKNDDSSNNDKNSDGNEKYYFLPIISHVSKGNCDKQAISTGGPSANELGRLLTGGRVAIKAASNHFNPTD